MNIFMKRKKRSLVMLAILMVCVISAPITTANAANTLAEVYWYTDTSDGGDGIGAGGSAHIKNKLEDMGYNAKRYKDVHAFYVRRTMNTDKVFVNISHGMPGRIVCLNDTTVSAKAVKSNDDNYSMAAYFSKDACSGMKFAYFGSCFSAKTDSNYGNLTTYITETLGAKSALGFTKAVSNGHAVYFEKQLFSQLYNGKTISSAASKAKSLTYDKYGSYGNIDSYKIAGNPKKTLELN